MNLESSDFLSIENSLWSCLSSRTQWRLRTTMIQNLTISATYRSIVAEVVKLWSLVATKERSCEIFKIQFLYEHATIN